MKCENHMSVRMIKNKHMIIHIFLCILNYFVGRGFQKEMALKAKPASDECDSALWASRERRAALSPGQQRGQRKTRWCYFERWETETLKKIFLHVYWSWLFSPVVLIISWIFFFTCGFSVLVLLCFCFLTFDLRRLISFSSYILGIMFMFILP